MKSKPYIIAALTAMVLALPLFASGQNVMQERIDGLRRIRAAGPVSESLADLWSDKKGINSCLRLRGRVRDAFTDERDSDYRFLIIESGGDVFYAAVYAPGGHDTPLRPLIGAEVSVVGIRDPAGEWNPRRMIGPHLCVLDEKDITVVKPAPKDPFAAPEVVLLYGPRPDGVVARGRQLARGVVLAAWGGRQFLMETANDGLVIKVTLADGELPRAGESVDVVGFPETDLYHINLSQAIWRSAQPRRLAPREAVAVKASDIFAVDGSDRRADTDYHGRLVRLVGTVRSPPGADGRMFLSDGGMLVPVDLGCAGIDPEAAAKLEIGALVEVTGVCVLEIDNWRQSAAFPRVNGFFVVARGPEDVAVVRSPPWWTPARLMAVIGIVLAALVVVLIWNVMLRAMAARLGRDFYREQLRHAKSALKVEERTRLAVELHDLLSQSLTGVSYAIGTAARRLDADPAAARERLETAAKSLASARTELRNCLWDLRSGVLDEADFGEAIRKTLAPSLGDAQLSVRFNVPRSKLADSTAHAILGIVRELAANAVRHGGAKSIRVAGSIDSAGIAFSLSDDGCGFDPATAPGFAQGHFGLQGVRERVSAMGGTVEIDSAPGRGARVEVRLSLHTGAEKGNEP